MKRLRIVLIILAIFQFACGMVTPSLWGTYSTPTSAPPTIPSTARPSRTPLPTASATITLTPSITPTAISSFITPTRGAAGVDEPNPTPRNTSAAPILYYTQSGDTLAGVARRFDVEVSEITATVPLPESIDLIDPGTLLVIPERVMDNVTPNEQILPDSEVVYTASALDFDIDAYLNSTDGYLNSYREYLGSTGWVTGPNAIRRLADENSINPRLLLAVLEYESRWVRGQPVDALHAEYPMGYEDFRYKSMFTQMVWAINQLSIGYYGWRNGTITELNFPDGTRLRLDPRLNAGTVAVQYLFSRLHSQSQWAQIINLETGFPALYEDMFGDPWARGNMVNPIFPPGLSQPAFGLPFDPRVEWSYTGGPHGAWEHDGALAAIDFAPATDHGGCAVTDAWVTASAPGLVVRSGQGVVVVDLDGDGYEQTGWTLLYLHIATTDRIRQGEWVDANDHIGHPSCEGGISTGTHLHFARKYNGEWVPADGPIPFVLDGWKVIAGQKPYEGLLVRGEKTIIADPVGQAWSIIFREPNVTPTPVGP
ncbi:MAG: peptidoglycan DD-metalloendopeptidase family protein [Chloroflexi bacterium]|nr:peptidoglycan DD-metalloendopeptidase family protein [Chloroflexota bacterium]